MTRKNKLSASDLQQSAHQACGLLKALSNADRLLLLCELTQGEKNVSELKLALGIVQPTLSQQLGVLREEGIVITRREGKKIYYQMNSTSALAVMQVLYEQFCQPHNTKKSGKL